MANRGASGTGGSGGAWSGQVSLTEARYRFVIGTGGYGYYGGLNDTPPASQNGGASALYRGVGNYYFFKLAGSTSGVYLEKTTPAVGDIVYNFIYDSLAGTNEAQPITRVSWVSPDGHTVKTGAGGDNQYTYNGAGPVYAQGTLLIIANGGTAGASYQSSATAGYGGTVGIGVEKVIVSTTYNIQGTNGNVAGYNATSQGVFTISGHTWGGTGNASGFAGGGNCYPSYHGMGYLSYKSPTNKGKLYKGTQLIKNIYIGSAPIKYVYKGSSLIWQREDYTPDQVIINGNTPQDIEFYITTPGVYELTLIGGGGGSSGSGGGGGGGLQTTRVDAIAGS